MHIYNCNPFERETHTGYATDLASVISTKAGTEEKEGGGGYRTFFTHPRTQGRSSNTRPSMAVLEVKGKQLHIKNQKINTNTQS